MSNKIKSVTNLAILGIALAITFGIGVASEAHQAHAASALLASLVNDNVFADGTNPQACNDPSCHGLFGISHMP